MVVDVVSTTQEISTLISAFTILLVPAIGGVIMGVINFINHHVHTTPNQRAALDRIAKAEGEIMVINSQIDTQKGAIAAAAASDPNISGAVAKHEAEITVAEAKIAQLTDELNKIKGSRPYNMTEEDNIVLVVLGGLGALALAFLGMQKPTTTASTGTASTEAPKAKSGCGCGR